MPSPRRHASLALPGVRTSAAAARRFTVATLSEWGVPVDCDDAVLLVSEMVTNGIMHAGTDVGLELTWTGSVLHVGVTDRQPGAVLQRRPLPHPRTATGRGLLLVEKLAASWGVDRDAGTKTVWFELASVGSTR